MYTRDYIRFMQVCDNPDMYDNGYIWDEEEEEEEVCGDER